MASALERSAKGSKYHRFLEKDIKPLVRFRNAHQRNPDKAKNPDGWVTDDSDEDADPTIHAPLPLLDPDCKENKTRDSDSMRKCSQYTMEVETLGSSAPWASIYVNDSSSTPITTFSLPPLIINGIRDMLNESWARGVKKEFGENGWIAQSFPSILNCEDGLTVRKSDRRFPDCYWLGVSLKDGEYLEVIGGSDELLNTMKLTLREMELVRERSKLRHHRDTGGDKMIDVQHSIYQFQLKPINRLSGKTIWQQRKLFVLRLLERLEERGWCLYTTYYTHLKIVHNKMYYPGLGHASEIRPSYEHATEGTWYFVKSKEWTPENPVKLEWKKS
ncbi:hypothetical protein ACMFMG_007161 [Clarireedia jacksonii]